MLIKKIIKHHLTKILHEGRSLGVLSRLIYCRILQYMKHGCQPRLSVVYYSTARLSAEAAAVYYSTARLTAEVAVVYCSTTYTAVSLGYL